MGLSGPGTAGEKQIKWRSGEAAAPFYFLLSAVQSRKGISRRNFMSVSSRWRHFFEHSQGERRGFGSSAAGLRGRPEKEDNTKQRRSRCFVLFLAFLGCRARSGPREGGQGPFRIHLLPLGCSKTGSHRGRADLVGLGTARRMSFSNSPHRHLTFLQPLRAPKPDRGPPGVGYNGEGEPTPGFGERRREPGTRRVHHATERQTGGRFGR